MKGISNQSSKRLSIKVYNPREIVKTLKTTHTFLT